MNAPDVVSFLSSFLRPIDNKIAVIPSFIIPGLYVLLIRVLSALVEHLFAICFTRYMFFFFCPQV